MPAAAPRRFAGVSGILFPIRTYFREQDSRNTQKSKVGMAECQPPPPQVCRCIGNLVPDTHLVSVTRFPKHPKSKVRKSGWRECQPPPPQVCRCIGNLVPDTHLLSGTRFPKHPKVESQKVGMARMPAAAPAGLPVYRESCSRYALTFGNKIPETPKSRKSGWPSASRCAPQVCRCIGNLVPDTHLLSGTRFPKHPKVESRDGRMPTAAPAGLPVYRESCSRYALSFGNKIPETPKVESQKVGMARMPAAAPAGLPVYRESCSRYALSFGNKIPETPKSRKSGWPSASRCAPQVCRCIGNLVPDTHLLSGTRFPKHPKVESRDGRVPAAAPRRFAGVSGILFPIRT